MNGRNVACLFASGLLGSLLFAATATPAIGPRQEVVIEAPRVDPALQRRVTYGDLNLAFAKDQKTLRRRISHTADDLCYELNGIDGSRECFTFAIRSTKDQVKAAIVRAEMRMAGRVTGPDVAITMALSAH